MKSTAIKHFGICIDPEGYEHCIETLGSGQVPTEGFIHVIEYSAYDQIVKERDDLYDRWKHWNDRAIKYARERDQLKSFLEETFRDAVPGDHLGSEDIEKINELLR